MALNQRIAGLAKKDADVYEVVRQLQAEIDALVVRIKALEAVVAALQKP